MISEYQFPTKITAGKGASEQLPSFLKDQGLHRPLIVTDRGVAKMSFLTQLIDSLKKADLTPTLFSEVWGNPTKKQVEAGADSYRVQFADCIVGIGGGAAIDVAKAIAILIHHKGDLFDYEDRPGAKSIDQTIPPIIAIPTTAGTGSEVGRSSVISDDQTKIKKILFSPKLMPIKVYLDPTLTLDLPASIMATTGLDALTHLLEAYLAKGVHPLCDGIALEGITMVARSLAIATVGAKKHTKGVDDDVYLAARMDMLHAAMMGAVAFQKGLGVTHSCAHALSTVCDLHHGLANGILLPYTMEFNFKGQAQKFKAIATRIGLKDGQSFIRWIHQLKKRIEIPTFLSEANVTKDHLDQLVDVAFSDGCHQCNPRPVLKKDLHKIFTIALGTSRNRKKK